MFYMMLFLRNLMTLQISFYILILESKRTTSITIFLFTSISTALFYLKFHLYFSLQCLLISHSLCLKSFVMVLAGVLHVYFNSSSHKRWLSEFQMNYITKHNSPCTFKDKSSEFFTVVTTSVLVLDKTGLIPEK